MTKTEKAAFSGPAVWSYGFRPFFLAAMIFAGLVVPYWLLVFAGVAPLNNPMPTVEWHIHEMLFGYTSAVVSGFLFTAIPNWTGRMPIRGWPLCALAMLWLVGRLTMLGFGGAGPIVTLVLDCSFMAAIVTVITIEIIAGRNWRNLIVLVPVGLFTIANLCFHIEVMIRGESDYSRRFGIAVVVFLITLIGGRVIPSFTQNWLVKRGDDKLPTSFNRFDRICLLGGIIGMISWVSSPSSIWTLALLLGAAVLHAIRLSRWRGLRTLRSPLLFILHFSYGFIPIGLCVLALNQQVSGFHILGIGAIGGMTVAVMLRATLGHTGRALEIHGSVLLGFLLLPVSLAFRILAEHTDGFHGLGITVSTVFWSAGFALILLQAGPWLWSQKEAKRKPS